MMALESELVLRPHMPKWMKRKQSLACVCNSKRKKTAMQAKNYYIEEQQSTNDKQSIMKEVGVRKESKELTWAANTLFPERDRVKHTMLVRRSKSMRKRLEGLLDVD